MEQLRVAIVDDEPAPREQLAFLLEESGCVVIEKFKDSEDFLDWFLSKGKVEIDVLFFDVCMPGLSGLELLTSLKNPPFTVFVTAYSHYAYEAYQADAIDYILKPATTEKIDHMIDKILKIIYPAITTKRIKQAIVESQKLKILAKVGESNLLLQPKAATHFEIKNSIVWAYIDGKPFQTEWKTLLAVEQQFKDIGYTRISRGMIVRIDAIVGFKIIHKKHGNHIELWLTKNIIVKASRSHTSPLTHLLRNRAISEIGIEVCIIK